jgi:hypothetical protein
VPSASGTLTSSARFGRLRLTREHLDAIRLEQQVDDERASRLPLAVQAVTAIDEHRLGRQPVANRSA